jgi:hypothetical protein
MGISLWVGYLWLVLAGAWMLFGEGIPGGWTYDAYLHAFFLGFVFSMIFAHALLIAPAVFRVALPYTPLLYLPLGGLYASLVMRLIGDARPHPGMRLWGGYGNVISLLLFLGILIGGLFQRR